MAHEREQFMLAVSARVLRCEWLTRLGDVAAAATVGRALVESCDAQGTPPALYAPEVWWVAHQALAEAEPALARHALTCAHRWIEEVAWPQVPVVFQRSFRERNPINGADAGRYVEG